MSDQNDEPESADALSAYKLSVPRDMSLSSARTGDGGSVRVRYRAIGKRPVSVSMTSLRPGAGGRKGCETA